MLRQFYFKLLHRILVTNKELKQFGITECDKCVMCGDNDSIEHAFFESFLKLPVTTVFLDTRLSKTKYMRKHFQNFCQSYMLSTDRIEIHQSQSA